MKRTEINIRDPFVLPYEGKYYMYGTRGASCWGACDGFDCYVSNDLEEWSERYEVFRAPDNFWADKNFWAPEVHFYQGSFYMFASFKADGICRGTQIMKSASPLGPFCIHSDGPVTPSDWECLDGTLFVDEGIPYIVFCHEWVQVVDGEVCALPLTADLKKPAGEPILLFRASEAPWIVPFRKVNYVTDGSFLYRRSDGKLLMLWSSFGKKGYTLAVAESKSGTVFGPWCQRPKLLFEKDGGHGMIFKTFSGKTMVTLHSPNETPKERPQFYEIPELF